MKRKYDELLQNIKSLDSVLVAFSGGVDSTFLLYSSLKALPPQKVVPVTVKTQFFSERQYSDALQTAETLQAGLEFVTADILTEEYITNNSSERCYYCKNKLFSLLLEKAHSQGFNKVIEGSTNDDSFDFRPGMRALKELKINSPLKEAGLTKEEIRQLSKEMGLPGWNKPAESCLATRIPYETPITSHNLEIVEKAEEMLHSLNFSNFRVRHHDYIARIEIEPAEFARLLENNMRQQIISGLKDLGYTYVTLDMCGYSQGSMNKMLK